MVPGDFYDAEEVRGLAHQIGVYFHKDLATHGHQLAVK